MSRAETAISELRVDYTGKIELLRREMQHDKSIIERLHNDVEELKAKLADFPPIPDKENNCKLCINSKKKSKRINLTFQEAMNLLFDDHSDVIYVKRDCWDDGNHIENDSGTLRVNIGNVSLPYVADQDDIENDDWLVYEE